MNSTENKPLENAAGRAQSGTSDAFDATVSGATKSKSSSTWFALRNPVFCRLWLATLLSSTFVSSQDLTATWLMHDLGASPFWLSLMVSAASAVLFVYATCRGDCGYRQPARGYHQRRPVAGGLVCGSCLGRIHECDQSKRHAGLHFRAWDWACLWSSDLGSNCTGHRRMRAILTSLPATL